MTNVAVGLFPEPESALAAAGTLKGAGFATPELQSPIPLEGVEDVLGAKKSSIKHFSFIGGITGAASGFLLASVTAVLYLHPTGGRPIIAIPPYLIITYEATILFGIVFTVLGFFVSARLPAMRNRVYVPEAGVDKFAVTVACEDDEHFTRAEAILREAGAEEIRELAEES